MCSLSSVQLHCLHFRLIICFRYFRTNNIEWAIFFSDLFFSISWSFHCEISELMIDTQGSEWSKDGEMKIDKCVWAEEAALIALYRENQIAQVSVLCWRRTCLRKPHHYNSNIAILNRLALVHYKFIWSSAHLVRLKHDSSSSLSRTTAMFHLCYSSIELQQSGQCCCWHSLSISMALQQQTWEDTKKQNCLNPIDCIVIVNVVAQLLDRFALVLHT